MSERMKALRGCLCSLERVKKGADGAAGRKRLSRRSTYEADTKTAPQHFVREFLVNGSALVDLNLSDLMGFLSTTRMMIGRDRGDLAARSEIEKEPLLAPTRSCISFYYARPITTSRQRNTSGLCPSPLVLVEAFSALTTYKPRHTMTYCPEVLVMAPSHSLTAPWLDKKALEPPGHHGGPNELLISQGLPKRKFWNDQIPRSRTGMAKIC